MNHPLAIAFSVPVLLVQESGAAILDVHVPQATHTWKDFFIHIATIVVGLFIAISLEQTVETIHHAHERHELVEDMRIEARQNMDVLHANLDGDIKVMQAQLALIALLRSAQPHAGVVKVVRPSSVPIPIHRYPARATWASAKTNGKIALLSVRQSAMYDLLDYRADMAILSIDRSDIATLKFRSDMYRLGVDMSPGTTFSLPAAEVPSVIADIALAAAAMRTTAGWDANWLAGCEAVSAGVRTREDFLPYFDQERVAITSRFPKS